MLIGNYLGDKFYGRQKLYFVFIVLFVLLLSNGLYYCNWNSTYGGWGTKICFLLFAFFLCTHKVNKLTFHFRNEMLALMLLQFPSIVNSWNYFGQSPMESFIADLGAFTYVTYFILHYYKVEESTILRAILCIGLLIVIIQVVQQITYPKCFFGINSEERQMLTKELAEQRNGLWRFRMHINGFYTAPVLFASWIWLQKKLNLSLMVICALLLVSIYLTLTRQVMVACLFAIFMASFIGNRKNKKGLLVLGLLLLVGLYEYYDVLFSSLADQTKDDSTEDNIRILSAAYFWNESLKDVFTFLFGYGARATSGTYALLMQRLNTDFGFYTADVGFIGQIYEKGIIYVLVTYWFFVKMYFKFKTQIPLYVKMMILFCVPMTPMIFAMFGPIYYFVWIMLAYVCDLHINKSPLAFKTTENI